MSNFPIFLCQSLSRAKNAKNQFDEFLINIVLSGLLRVTNVQIISIFYIGQMKERNYLHAAWQL